MTTPKQQFILDQRTLYPNEPLASFVSILNSLTLVNNPIQPQPTVPKRFTVEEAFVLVPDAEAFKVSETRTYSRLLDAFSQGRIDWVQDNIKTLVAGGAMSFTTAQALGELMSQTEPDPNWKSKVMLSPAELAGFGTILTDEVVEALK